MLRGLGLIFAKFFILFSSESTAGVDEGQTIVMGVHCEEKSLKKDNSH